jgi:flagellar hook assembly protein FlgD
VLTLVSGKVEAGTHNVRWDGTDSGGNHVAPGIYLCRLETAGTVLARKMVLLK